MASILVGDKSKKIQRQKHKGRQASLVAKIARNQQE